MILSWAVSDPVSLRTRLRGGKEPVSYEVLDLVEDGRPGGIHFREPPLVDER